VRSTTEQSLLQIPEFGIGQSSRRVVVDIARYNDYYSFVAGKSNNGAIQRRRMGSLEEDVFVNLWRTADLLSRRLEEVLKAADISPTQYNVLRILRGAPDGLPCGEIGSRMVSRDPDITRLLNRLEKRGLISRAREKKDRRMIVTRVTTAGLRLLSELDDPIAQVHKQQLGHLGRERVKALGELLETARERTS
jgi:DNA-binding MarR family transcriptional regulator